MVSDEESIGSLDSATSESVSEPACSSTDREYLGSPQVFCSAPYEEIQNPPCASEIKRYELIRPSLGNEFAIKSRKFKRKSLDTSKSFFSTSLILDLLPWIASAVWMLSHLQP